MVPAEPHSTGAVSCASGSPDEETRLPLLHGQLLQEVRQVSEPLGIGQDNVGVSAEIVGLPELQQRHDHGQILSG